MNNLPLYINILFIITTITTLFIFLHAVHFSKVIVLIAVGWLAVQAAISRAGFYTAAGSFPPRLALAVLPPLLLIALLFSIPAGKRLILSLKLPTLTLLHTIRIPVELVLLSLYLHKTIPVTMTFEGHNFDILSGITAPLMYYAVFVKKWFGKKYLLVWNLLCLFLLMNVVVTAILSAPSPIQRFSFDQPNIAILYFPFVWLPSFVVPVVLFCHLAAIKQILPGLARGPQNNQS